MRLIQVNTDDLLLVEYLRETTNINRLNALYSTLDKEIKVEWEPVTIAIMQTIMLNAFKHDTGLIDLYTEYIKQGMVMRFKNLSGVVVSFALFSDFSINLLNQLNMLYENNRGRIKNGNIQRCFRQVGGVWHVKECVY